MDFKKHKINSSHGDGMFKPDEFSFLGENVIFEKGVLVFHPQNIRIGNNVYVGHNTILKGYHQNEMLIGDHTWIGQNCFFHSAGGIRIGKAVGIGPYVKIISSSHKNDDLSLPILFHELVFKEVVIEDGADLGIGTIVLPGVTIGEGSVVGAGSVITRDIPPFHIVAGVPAKIIKERKG